MRKSIRPFVVETKKSRHDKPSTEQALFRRLITEAAEPAAPAPGRDPFFSGLAAHEVDPFAQARGAPARVLESLQKSETELERRIREAEMHRERRPSVDADASDGETADLESARPARLVARVETAQPAASAPAKRGRRAARTAMPATPQQREEVCAPMPAVVSVAEPTTATQATDAQPTRKTQGKLPPSMRWAERLPRSVQDRMLARAKRRS
jgi:hypothetical protein